MVQNRIRRYEALWATSAMEPETQECQIPEGFTVQLLGHLTPDERRAIAERKDLYSWAYEQARKQSDQKLFWDWSI
ncbi:MAG: hypothetical protein ACK5Q3_05700 [Planctomycetota bacterium]|jgi:hypothetical protein